MVNYTEPQKLCKRNLFKNAVSNLFPPTSHLSLVLLFFYLLTSVSCFINSFNTAQPENRAKIPQEITFYHIAWQGIQILIYYNSEKRSD